VSFRPNHVFHQNKNGIRQISQAVRKKRSFWVRDVPRFAGEERGASVSIICLAPHVKLAPLLSPAAADVHNR
jgi:hypothetical protein